MAIKAIGFDLDGTLYPAWLLYLASVDLGVRHPSLLRAYGKARRELRSPNAPGSLDPEMGSQVRTAPFMALRARQASIVSGRTGLDPARAEAAISRIIYSTVPERFRFIRPYGNVAECLAALKRRGFRLGLLSDLPPERKLALLGLERFFDVVLCAEDCGALKPDSRPFRALAAGLGVEPRDMLYVGNKRDYDVAGAAAVGMRTALISWKSCPEADFTFRRWSDLTRWVLERSR